MMESGEEVKDVSEYSSSDVERKRFWSRSHDTRGKKSAILDSGIGHSYGLCFSRLKSV